MTDKAGRDYWKKLWENDEIPLAIDPYKNGLNNYVNKKFHDYFKDIFKKMETDKIRLLKIGSANSVWFPYFANKTESFFIALYSLCGKKG